MRATVLFPALITVLLTGCADDAPLAPRAAVPHAASMAQTGAGAEFDLTGNWAWSEVTYIKLRPFPAQLFGFNPEGPVTHITCEAGGTLAIQQTGDTFTGNATQAGTCVTRGGQSTTTPPFPPTLELIDGVVHGRSFSFTYDAGPFPAGGQVLCLYRGAVRVEGGVAVRLEGTGDCLLPNEHLFGHDLIVTFTATRL